MTHAFTTTVHGGTLSGSRSGSGPPVLVLHGGPGLSDYTEGLEAELAGFCDLIRYTQRGVAPSVESGPYTIEQHVEDAMAVLDSLGIDRAWILGHSWGGMLAMHLVITRPDRVLGLISVSSMGATGDAGGEAFEATLIARTPPEIAERAAEIDARAMRGEATDEESAESLRMFWPAYFADPASAPSAPAIAMSATGYSGALASVIEHLEADTLARELPGLTIPALLVHGEQDPIPIATAEEVATLIDGARLERMDDCGHFPWIERPGVLGGHVREFISA